MLRHKRPWKWQFENRSHLFSKGPDVKVAHLHGGEPATMPKYQLTKFYETSLFWDPQKKGPRKIKLLFPLASNIHQKISPKKNYQHLVCKKNMHQCHQDTLESWPSSLHASVRRLDSYNIHCNIPPQIPSKSAWEIVVKRLMMLMGK